MIYTGAVHGCQDKELGTLALVLQIAVRHSQPCDRQPLSTGVSGSTKKLEFQRPERASAPLQIPIPFTTVISKCITNPQGQTLGSSAQAGSVVRCQICV
jgi:hypothetical protein